MAMEFVVKYEIKANGTILVIGKLLTYILIGTLLITMVLLT